jgi:hypothetical protein
MNGNDREDEAQDKSSMMAKKVEVHFDQEEEN